MGPGRICNTWFIQFTTSFLLVDFQHTSCVFCTKTIRIVKTACSTVSDIDTNSTTTGTVSVAEPPAKVLVQALLPALAPVQGQIVVLTLVLGGQIVAAQTSCPIVRQQAPHLNGHPPNHSFDYF